MSESKYQPPVNMPQNVPGHPEHPASLTVLFLQDGKYVAIGGQDLTLYQINDTEVALGARAGDKFVPLVTFPGKFLTEEKKVVLT